MPGLPRARSNVRALEKTLSALAEMGHFEDVDAATIHAARAIAAELDRDPGKASLWREYQIALRGLRKDDSGAGDLDELFKDLRAPVRDPAKS